jgi:hypothetical protein
VAEAANELTTSHPPHETVAIFARFSTKLTTALQASIGQRIGRVVNK